MSTPFDVVFLGTGAPLNNPDRCGCGQVIVAGDTHVMVDCGWGSARRIVPAGLRPADIGTAVFTHMHSDHITDFPDFIFQRWTGGATTPLKIFGPAGTKETMEGFMAALRLDIGFRLAHHGDKLHPEGAKIEVVEIPATPNPNQFHVAGDLVLESFEVDHFPVVPALGYKFSVDGRTAVLSGDTSLCDSLVAAAENADLFVCEAMNQPMMTQLIGMLEAMGRKREAGLMSDVPDYHITTTQVAEVAKKSAVRELVLTHIIPPVPNDTAREADFMAGMAEIYGGPIRMARDTQRVSVGKRE